MENEGRIIGSNRNFEEESLEISLRPRWMKDYIGQKRLKKN